MAAKSKRADGYIRVIGGAVARASRSSRPTCNGRRSPAGRSCTRSRSSSGGRRSISRAPSSTARCSRRLSRAANAARRAGSSSPSSIASRARRSTRSTSIRRLNEAGARLVSVEDDFDGSTPMGRFAIGILTLIAELELERIKESWATAVTRAVERGIHISRVHPDRLRDATRTGGSQRDEPAAPSSPRSSGAARPEPPGPSSLASSKQSGVLPPTGNPHWSKVGRLGAAEEPGLPRPGPQRRAP